MTETKPRVLDPRLIVCGGARTTVDGIDPGFGQGGSDPLRAGNGIRTYVNTRTIYSPQMGLSRGAQPHRGAAGTGSDLHLRPQKNVGDIALETDGQHGRHRGRRKLSPVLTRVRRTPNSEAWRHVGFSSHDQPRRTSGEHRNRDPPLRSADDQRDGNSPAWRSCRYWCEIKIVKSATDRQWCTKWTSNTPTR